MTLAFIPSRLFPSQIISGIVLSSTNYFSVPLLLCIRSAPIIAVTSLCSTVIILLTLPESSWKGFCRESHGCTPFPSVPDPGFSSLQSYGFSSLTVEAALLSGHTVRYLRTGMMLCIIIWMMMDHVWICLCIEYFCFPAHASCTIDTH